MEDSIQDLILLFKIPMITRKNFLEIYIQFWHAPLKRFASPAHKKLKWLSCPTRIRVLKLH